MKLVRSFVQRDPSMVLTVLTLLAGAICGAVGHPEYSAVLVAMAAAVLGLRTKVTPQGKAEANVVDAAHQVAERLTSDIAGLPGQILPEAQDVVNGVIGGVLGKAA